MSKKTSGVKSKVWDVVVIGGGPAGMISAGRAAERGKSVLLLEKNPSLGKKLLITGGGRCNLTNNKLELNTLVSSYKGRPKALFSVFSQFGVEDTLEFFHSRGMDTKIEEEGRIFPVTDRARSVWQVMLDYLKSENVNIQTNNRVLGLSKDDSSKFIKIDTENGQISTWSCVVATGGTSYPDTGSTGDGFKWLESLGHTIHSNDLSLVPISIKDLWVKTLSGLTLKDIKISLWQDNKKVISKEGKLLFTHFGISGPTILNMSSKIRELLRKGAVIVKLDLIPEVSDGELKNKLHDLLSTESNKMIKNSLKNIIPSTLVKPLLSISKIDPDKKNNSITKPERTELVRLIKGLPMEVKGLLGPDKAIVSSGGVDIDEVNFQTMESRIVPNLYIVGDCLNIDRLSGGYSLQICWATGFVSGENA